MDNGEVVGERGLTEGSSSTKGAIGTNSEGATEEECAEASWIGVGWAGAGVDLDAGVDAGVEADAGVGVGVGGDVGIIGEATCDLIGVGEATGVAFVLGGIAFKSPAASPGVKAGGGGGWIAGASLALGLGVWKVGVVLLLLLYWPFCGGALVFVLVVALLLLYIVVVEFGALCGRLGWGE